MNWIELDWIGLEAATWSCSSMAAVLRTASNVALTGRRLNFFVIVCDTGYAYLRSLAAVYFEGWKCVVFSFNVYNLFCVWPFEGAIMRLNCTRTWESDCFALRDDIYFQRWMRMLAIVRYLPVIFAKVLYKWAIDAKLDAKLVTRLQPANLQRQKQKETERLAGKNKRNA